MKYNITINQFSIIENRLNLDLVDACLLTYLFDFALSSKIVKVSFDNEVFFFFNHDKIIKDLPILKLKKDSVYRRLKNLCELGFLRQHPNSKQLNMTMYSFTEKIDLLMFSDAKKQQNNTIGLKSEPSDENPKPIGRKSEGPSDENPMYNNINNNNINYKRGNALQFLQKNNISMYESLLMKYQSKIKDFEKAIIQFNLQYDVENREYDAKVINARAQLYFNRWLENQNKYQQMAQPIEQQTSIYRKNTF